MFRKYTLFLLLFLQIQILNAQDKSTRFTISGYVKDASTGEALIGANVYLRETMKGVQTNTYGYYSITVDGADSITLMSSFVGFSDFLQKMKPAKDVRLNINLRNKYIEAQEVVITAKKEDQNVNSTQMGTVQLDVEQIKTLPAFMGEVDILKTIQLLPGVQSAGEGNTGFYVRGGGPDQNLILLDEALVYNASHLFGFFSVFNSDAINNVSLIKGGMPANYGGRLASVLDISLKEGNNKEFKVEGGLGPIASRLTLQGPIQKEKSSFIVSGRRTFIDLFQRPPFVKKGSNAANNTYYFYDLNAKINYQLSDKDRLFLSGYFGRDVFNFKSADTGFKFRIPWGNATAVLRWNHLFSDKLFVNTSIIFSDYNFAFNAKQESFSFNIFSGIRDYNAKVDFNWFPIITHNIKFGVNYTYHRFTPTSAEASQDSTDFDLGGVNRLYAHEAAAYINDDWTISDKFSVSAGLRYSLFDFTGPFTRYVKNEDNETIDTIIYKTNETVGFYHGLEPRISAKYSLDKNSSIKASFTQNYQYVHLASFTSVTLPTDVWVPSSDRVKPQDGRLYAAGYFRNFHQNMFETSVEVYYKTMRNQIEYREGAQADDDVKNNTDNNFVFGKGWSYGAEFFIKKAKGKLNGWVGYTLSYTDRKFPDIMNGKTFPAKYDRRHDISVVVSYNASKRWTFGLTWVYATGNATTLPVSRYFMFGPLDLQGVVSSGLPNMSSGQIYDVYGDRNSYRMAAYHRLDLSATYIKKKTKRFESSWNFSIYNVYSRMNPYFIYFNNEVDKETGEFQIQAKQVSLFPIIPSVTYNFKF
ncbi:MAG TPA: TonB-dependent receptor [Bacteroidia bacterium]|jgi:hypothetical protein|nr:TonB-dependent receptor [Bacteroidia bacterium]HMU19586.1 TonB-dependent receptor [Bacteroidia bacterium]